MVLLLSDCQSPPPPVVLKYDVKVERGWLLTVTNEFLADCFSRCRPIARYSSRARPISKIFLKNYVFSLLTFASVGKVEYGGRLEDMIDSAVGILHMDIIAM